MVNLSSVNHSKSWAKNIAWLFGIFTIQSSPYQAVTGKIYRLKQQFLLPATA